jgi:GMP synthase-like glutamine amidotransferase
MRIGILQCDKVRDMHRDRFKDYPGMFEQLLLAEDSSLDLSVFAALDGELPEKLEACDAYLITGSRFGVYEDHQWIRDLEALVRNLFAAAIPVIGICFGHQIIAQALGGQVEKSGKGWGVGVHTWKLAVKPDWMNHDDEHFSMLVSHQDQVHTLPANGKTLAQSEFCSIAAFQIGSTALGFQGHPEFSKAYSEAIMELRRDIIGEEIYQTGMTSLSQVPQGSVVARWTLDFISHVLQDDSSLPLNAD